MTISCCRILSSRISARRWRNWRRWALGLTRTGSPRIWRSASRMSGRSTLRGMELELRNALEPWHVLGEEQVGRRHRALCRQFGRTGPGAGLRLGGRTLRAGLQRRRGAADPDRPRGRICRRGAVQGVEPAERAASDDRGACAAGVRRVRPLERPQPGRADLPCLASRRPELRDLPVNANEAEARRRSRFFPFGHTPGPMPEPVVQRSREHPRTLDLRRV